MSSAISWDGWHYPSQGEILPAVMASATGAGDRKTDAAPVPVAGAKHIFCMVLLCTAKRERWAWP
ncbi:MAG: hypothetical protein ACETVZ_07890 [Phycisphaerae bacterium]